MQNNNLLNKNKYEASQVNPEKLIQSKDKKEIAMIHAQTLRDYALFNSETGEQLTPWVNGKNGTIKFSNLNPLIKYEVKAKENNNKDKPLIHIDWNLPLVNNNKSKKMAG